MPSSEWHAALVRLLFFPALFFEERTPRRGIAGRVVAAVAVIQVLALFGIALLLALRVSTAVEGTSLTEPLGTFGGRMTDRALPVVGLVLLDWLVVTAVLHVCTSVAGGRGDVFDTLFVVGWSTPATLVTPLVAAGVVLLSTPTLRPWDAVGEEVDLLVANVVATELFVGALVLVWRAYVWIGGLRAVHGLDRSGASKAAVGAVAVLGLLTVLVLGA